MNRHFLVPNFKVPKGGLRYGPGGKGQKLTPLMLAQRIGRVAKASQKRDGH